MFYASRPVEARWQSDENSGGLIRDKSAGARFGHLAQHCFYPAGLKDGDPDRGVHPVEDPSASLGYPDKYD